MRSRFPDRAGAAALLIAAAVFVLGCPRRLHEEAPLARLSESDPSKRPPAPVTNPYAGNSYAMSEGQRLFTWYNCSGCHARGGGGIGPALMRKRWIYGGDPGHLYESIVDGRPNGMPAWRGRIPEYQVWQLVTFIGALQADRGIAAPPGPRQEHLQAGEGEVSR